MPRLSGPGNRDCCPRSRLAFWFRQMPRPDRPEARLAICFEQKAAAPTRSSIHQKTHTQGCLKNETTLAGKLNNPKSVRASRCPATG